MKISELTLCVLEKVSFLGLRGFSEPPRKHAARVSSHPSILFLAGTGRRTLFCVCAVLTGKQRRPALGHLGTRTEGDFKKWAVQKCLGYFIP